MRELTFRGKPLRTAEEKAAIALRPKTSRQLGEHYGTPDIPYGAVWCDACQKPCEFDITHMHNFSNPGSSKVVMRAYCHGDFADVMLTFFQWHTAKTKRIEVFSDLTLKNHLGQFLLMDRAQTEEPALIEQGGFATFDLIEG